MLTEITPLILTFDEAPNIGRTLEKLTWAKEILVVDSFSTDETLNIVKSFPQAHIVQRKFDSHTNQWNFGIVQINTPWVLALDADYVLPQNFVKELENLGSVENVSGFYAKFRYCVFGRPLRGTLYPPRAVLFRKDRCRYIPDGHTQLLQIQGRTEFLQSVIDHDDRKPLERWFGEQIKYASQEAEYLLSSKEHKAGSQEQGTRSRELNMPDRIRKKIVLAPAFVFFYTLFGKGLILDGWPGWYYVFQRTLAEILLSLKLVEMKFQKQKTESGE